MRRPELRADGDVLQVGMAAGRGRSVAVTAWLSGVERGRFLGSTRGWQAHST